MTTETPNPANGGAPARTTANSAGADLDGLLNEFTSPQPGAIQPDPARQALKALEPVIEFAQTEMTTRAKAAHDGDIKKAVDFVKEEDWAKDLSPRLVRGLLEGHAAENEGFSEAFKNRQKDPAAWQRELAGARGKLADEVKGLPGNTVKSDVEAARAAVAGQTTTAGESKLPSPNVLMKLSPQEYEKAVQEAIAAQR